MTVFQMNPRHAPSSSIIFLCFIVLVNEGCSKKAKNPTDSGNPSGDSTWVDTLPVHAGTRVLRNGMLSVEIDDPGVSVHNQYNRSARRFSPAAMVLRAQFKGKEFFYSPVNGGAYGNVGGAPMEFDLGENVMNKPPGFEEAVMNATDGRGDFLKVGVGILRKNTASYSWQQDYPAVEPAGTRVLWDDSSEKVTFLQTLRGTANGYAYSLDATVSLSDNRMVIEYRLKNTGTKRFTTEQYIHNFLVFSGMPVGPNYEVRLPYDFELQNDMGPSVRRKAGSNTLEFWKRLTGAVKFRLTTPAGYTEPNALTVVQTNVKQSLAIDVSLPSNAVDMWCTDQQLSPEMLVLITLDPGEETRWTRTYAFSVDAK